MADELSKTEKNTIIAIEGNELGNIIKPLIKEIHLFDSYIAGTTHIDDKSLLEQIHIGDSLNLQRESTNQFDGNAIMLLTAEKKKIGYVPEKDNIVFARLMDAGKLLKAKITGIDLKGNFKQIHVGIYLVDF